MLEDFEAEVDEDDTRCFDVSVGKRGSIVICEVGQDKSGQPANIAFWVFPSICDIDYLDYEEEQPAPDELISTTADAIGEEYIEELDI